MSIFVYKIFGISLFKAIPNKLMDGILSIWTTGKLGLSVCYDMRFPEMYIPLVQQGAQILLAPSAFTVPTGAAHWHTLLKGK
jgi:predicted amidohydrolase